MSAAEERAKTAEAVARLGALPMPVGPQQPPFPPAPRTYEEKLGQDVARLQGLLAEAVRDAHRARSERDLMRERVSEPFGCAHCGERQRSHGRRYIASVGVHAWERPSDEQIKDRMLARHVARMPLTREAPEHGPLWSLLDWSLWGAGMGDVFREPLADAMLAGVPAETIAQAEQLMAEFIERRKIEKTGVTVWQEQRDELKALRARVAELEAVLAAGRARHVQYEDSPHCQLDGEFWPCGTVAALDAGKRVAATSGEPTAAEVDRCHEAAEFDHECRVCRSSADGITRRIAPTQALREDAEPAHPVPCRWPSSPDCTCPSGGGR